MTRSRDQHECVGDCASAGVLTLLQVEAPPYAPNLDHRPLALGSVFPANYLSFCKVGQLLPIKLGAQNKSWNGHRNGGHFTLIKLSYLMVGLFHDLLRTLS